MSSELRPMKFDEYYSIKLGMPENELPTIAFLIMNEFGAFGDEMYGSIHANYPVRAYSPPHINHLLTEHIAKELGVDARFVQVASILGKPIEVENILDYVNCNIDTVTIDTGVQLSSGPPSSVLTVSNRCRPETGDEVYAFATDIKKLREMRQTDYEIFDPEITVGPWSGKMVCLRDLVAKYKHRFAIPVPKKAEPDTHTIDRYLARILEWQKLDIHIRSIFRESKNYAEVTLGNCWMFFDQRPKTLKVTVQTKAVKTASGENRYYTAQSRKTIDAALNDVLAVERAGWVTGLGHYNTSKRVQYDAKGLHKWFMSLAKTHKLVVSEYYESAAKGGTECIELIHVGPAGRECMARLRICFLHAEIEVWAGDGLWNRTHFYHATCETDGKRAVALQLIDALK